MTKPCARGLIGALVVAGSLVLAAPSAASRASSARVPVWTTTAREQVRTHLVRKSGNELYESGSATGTFAASVSGRVSIGVVSHFMFVLTDKHGSVRVAGIGYAVSLGVRARFRGTARIIRGTGRYAAARGSVGLSSVVDRSTWSMVGTVAGTVVL
jgi:hypothetical protein